MTPTNLPQFEVRVQLAAGPTKSAPRIINASSLLDAAEAQAGMELQGTAAQTKETRWIGGQTLLDLHKPPPAK